MISVDDKYLEMVIDILDGKKEVSSECMKICIKQGRRLIWIERQKLKRRTAGLKDDSCKDVVF